MATFKKFLYLLLALLFLVGVGLVLANYYSLIFSRHVTGEIVDVQRVNSNLAVVGSNTGDIGLFSFAVAIRDAQGQIHTASSEDRQWAVAKAGFCAEAIFYPYPPWNFEKAGTYMNARLIQLRDCAKPNTAPNVVPPVAPSPAPAATP